MILVIVNKERDPRSGMWKEIVSHGVDVDTGMGIVLPQEPPHLVGAIFDTKIGEYVLRDQQKGRA